VNFTYVVQPGAGGFPAGTYTDANSDGFWLMLEPLSAGEHTIHFGGTSNPFPAENPLLPSFTVDVTDHVTAGAAAIPLPAGALAALPVMSVLAAAKAFRRCRADWGGKQRSGDRAPASPGPIEPRRRFSDPARLD
jgi:hypothetical protein